MKMLSLCLLFAVSTACRQSTVANNSATTIEVPDSAATAKDFKWVYYEYGELQPTEYVQAQQTVLKRYGIEKEDFGCVVTDKLVHNIKAHNDSLFTLLLPKFPGFTEARMNSEIQALATKP